MNELQKYFRDVMVRLDLTQSEISEMCICERSTVTKWLKPPDHRINNKALKQYRQTLIEKGMYAEIAVFDKAYRSTFGKEIENLETFDTEYKPLPHDDCLMVNKGILPECLYNEADIYNLTAAFPNYIFFEIMIGKKRYKNLTNALDKILPAASQAELLRYERLYEINSAKLSMYGLTDRFFTDNILMFTCIPRHMGEIPEELRYEVYRERVRYKYLDTGEKTDVNALINTMTQCSSENIIISVPRSKMTKVSTGREKELTAIELFTNTYMTEKYISPDKMYRLFNVRSIDETNYCFTLTDEGQKILSIVK